MSPPPVLPPNSDDDPLHPPRPQAEELAAASGQRCNRCRHYFITHDPLFPYGCRAMDFKSAREPRRDVLDASHHTCLYFQPKGGDGKHGQTG